MVLVYGEPENAAKYLSYESWDACMISCYQSSTCLLVYKASDECRLFEFQNVAITKLNTSEKIIAFKRNFSSSCPISTDAPLFDQNPSTEIEVISGTVFNKTLYFDGTRWIFTYSIYNCTPEAQLYSRGSNYVCIATRLFPNSGCGSYYNASDLCKSNGGMSLTGPYSNEENVLVTNQTRLQLATFQNPTGYAWYSIWIDGIANSTVKAFVFDDETHNGSEFYPWFPGEPNENSIPACLNTLFKNEGVSDIEYKTN